mgnify:CR=1 FL=1
MKFFNSVGPNPRVVRVFMSELGLTMDQDTVDIMAGENRQPPPRQRGVAVQTAGLDCDSPDFCAERSQNVRGLFDRGLRQGG